MHWAAFEAEGVLLLMIREGLSMSGMLDKKAWHFFSHEKLEIEQTCR